VAVSGAPQQVEPTARSEGRTIERGRIRTLTSYLMRFHVVGDDLGVFPIGALDRRREFLAETRHRGAQGITAVSVVFAMVFKRNL